MLRRLSTLSPLLLTLALAGGCQDAAELRAPARSASMSLSLANTPKPTQTTTKLAPADIEIDARAFKKIRFAGKRLKPAQTFALRLAGTKGEAATILFNLEGDKARLFVLGEGDQPALLWEAPVVRDGSRYTMIGKDKQPRTPIEIKDGKLVTGKSTLPAISVKGGGMVPLVAVDGDLSRLLGKVGAVLGQPGVEYVVPPYEGCCGDCCDVHEKWGFPDWCDAFCCQGTCGGAGSCTPPDDRGGEGVDPDEDTDEIETETPEG